MSKGATVAIVVGGIAATAGVAFWILSHRKSSNIAAAANPQVGAAAAPPAPTTPSPTGAGLVDIGLKLASELITTYGGRSVAGSGQLADQGLDRYVQDLGTMYRKATA